MPNIPVRQIKESFFEERFSVRRIESLTANQQLVHDLHRHDFYFVLFVEIGSGEHDIDFIHYEVTDSAVFFVRPGQVHRLLLEQGTRGFMLQFTTDFYTPKDLPAIQVLRKVSNKNFCQLSQDRFQHLFSLLELVFAEFTDKQERYKESVRAYLDILFIALARQSSRAGVSVDKSNVYALERLDELQDLLEKNIRDHKQVSDYARMMSITTYQLNAITKSTLHKTASELINEHILLEAKRLLIATTNQVVQIADLLGYDDPSYFIRFFKKQTGFTPEAFRQKFK